MKSRIYNEKINSTTFIILTQFHKSAISILNNEYSVRKVKY